MRLRNAKNVPPEWAAQLVEPQTITPSFVDLPDGHLGAFLPINLKAQCLACHGNEDEIAGDVRSVLAELYPDDRATGFREGELRGWFWVDVPVPAGTRRAPRFVHLFSDRKFTMTKTFPAIILAASLLLVATATSNSAAYSPSPLTPPPQVESQNRVKNGWNRGALNDNSPQISFLKRFASCQKVEAAGIEPASRNNSLKASTCIVDYLVFASIDPCRPGSIATSRELV